MQEIETEKFLVEVEAPSNIAFIKYWGKSDSQVNWPANDSLSMTLKNCRTITKVGLLGAGENTVFFSGLKLEPIDKRAEKINIFIQQLRQRGAEIYAAKESLGRDRIGTNEKEGSPQGKGCGTLDFSKALANKNLRKLEGKRNPFASALLVSTTNTFPTASGIASSASGFAALTIAAIAAWTGAESFQGLSDYGFDIQTLANLARLGSGSACRSIMGGYVEWTRGESIHGQQMCQVIPAPGFVLSDLVIVLSAEPKAISSRNAHLMAASSPLFGPRIAHIPERIASVKNALETGRLDILGPLLEAEALEIHAISMTGSPAVRYLSADTIAFLTWMRYFRQQQQTPGYFTIDAGPNVHVICEKSWEKTWIQAINKSFPQAQIIVDGVGEGPSLRRLLPN